MAILLVPPALQSRGVWLLKSRFFRRKQLRPRLLDKLVQLDNRCHMLPLPPRQGRQTSFRLAHFVAEVLDEYRADPAGDDGLDDALQYAAGDGACARHRLEQR